ncbi:MAG: hypothetical protein ABIT71_10830 [Vicinamibacteraceae bacterium]
MATTADGTGTLAAAPPVATPVGTAVSGLAIRPSAVMAIGAADRAGATPLAASIGVVPAAAAADVAGAAAEASDAAALDAAAPGVATADGPPPDVAAGAALSGARSGAGSTGYVALIVILGGVGVSATGAGADSDEPAAGGYQASAGVGWLTLR